jgi:hypothetical protein
MNGADKVTKLIEEINLQLTTGAEHFKIMKGFILTRKRFIKKSL